MIGLYGAFQTVDGLNCAGPSEVFKGDIERGIGPRVRLFDQGFGVSFAEPLGGKGLIAGSRSFKRGLKSQWRHVVVLTMAGGGERGNGDSERVAARSTMERI